MGLATVEKVNGFLQRLFYALVKQRRGGGIQKLLAEAVEQVNSTTSRITKFRPNDAVDQTDHTLALKYNAKRQAPGKQLLPKIKRGQLARYLLVSRKADKFYKSYRKKYSEPFPVTEIRGSTYKLNGKFFPRNRIIGVKAVDQKSKQLIASRGAKKQLTPAERAAKTKDRKEKKAILRAHHKVEPRRSKRAATQSVHKK